jgi:hypothetical protein
MRVRLKLFYEGLSAAPRAASMDEAYSQICNILLRVEDAHSGISKGSGLIVDGRMYPPMSDSRRPVPKRPDLIRYRSRKHNTYLSRSGAILIVSIEGVTEFSKPGSDDKEIVL